MDAKWRAQEATETREDNLNPNLDGASVLKEKPVPFIMELNTLGPEVKVKENA